MLLCEIEDDHDHNQDLGWGGARRVVGFTELWGHRIRFRRIAYSSVLLLWLGFIVGLKLELRVGWLLWLGFEAGLNLELGVGLKLEGSFPFLHWWCLVMRKRTENYERHKQHLRSPPCHQTHGWSTTIQTHEWISLYLILWLLIAYLYSTFFC